MLSTKTFYLILTDTDLSLSKCNFSEKNFDKLIMFVKIFQMSAVKEMGSIKLTFRVFKFMFDLTVLTYARQFRENTPLNRSNCHL